ncbi:hypothetical protein J6590_067766 [Homalodisca vitripennis]|nr:hypothetical protein J6590_067766 [Homalodisca vitripennis]
MDCFIDDGSFGRITGFRTFAIVIGYKRYNTTFRGLESILFIRWGGINIYKNNEQKELKKGSTYPKAAWSQSRRCHCTGCKSRAQITSTRITVTHHTSTGYSGIQLDGFSENSVG